MVKKLYQYLNLSLINIEDLIKRVLANLMRYREKIQLFFSEGDK